MIDKGDGAETISCSDPVAHFKQFLGPNKLSLYATGFCECTHMKMSLPSSELQKMLALSMPPSVWLLPAHAIADEFIAVNAMLDLYRRYT